MRELACAGISLRPSSVAYRQVIAGTELRKTLSAAPTRINPGWSEICRSANIDSAEANEHPDFLNPSLSSLATICFCTAFQRETGLNSLGGTFTGKGRAVVYGRLLETRNHSLSGARHLAKHFRVSDLFGAAHQWFRWPAWRGADRGPCRFFVLRSTSSTPDFPDPVLMTV